MGQGLGKLIKCPGAICRAFTASPEGPELRRLNGGRLEVKILCIFPCPLASGKNSISGHQQKLQGLRRVRSMPLFSRFPPCYFIRGGLHCSTERPFCSGQPSSYSPFSEFWEPLPPLALSDSLLLLDSLYPLLISLNPALTVVGTY